MREIRFTKMQGAGNDFIIINNIEEKIPEEKLSVLASALCREHFSIGADGFMAVEAPRQGGDFRMAFYNRDGSPAEMCGNGARCISRYGYEHGLAGEVQRIETDAGMVTGKRIAENMYQVKLNEVTKMELNVELKAEGGSFTCDYVEMGEPDPLPHAVVEIKGLGDLSAELKDRLRETGRSIRSNPHFPKGANVNFYDIEGEDRVRELTFERGVEDFTLACGTGTGSVAAVLTRQGRVSGRNVRVMVPGGDLFVTVEKSEDGREDIFLTGPADVVAEGLARDQVLDEITG